MTKSHRFATGEPRIRVVDDVLHDTELRELVDHIGRMSLEYGNFGDASHAEMSFPMWGKQLLGRAGQTALAPPFARVFEKILELEPDLQCMRAYINAQTHGQDSDPHFDHTHRTAIVYLNPEWSYLHGGETLFFERGEIIFAVTPKPGRVVVFDGDIEHWGRPPNRWCRALRLTLAFQCRRQDHRETDAT